MDKYAASDAGLPQSDKEWDDFFRANHWRGSENEGDDVSTAGDYAADPSGRSAPEPYKAPSRDTGDRDQTVCYDCASYMANGEGDPDHERRFDQGMRDLARRGISGHNLTFNDQDEEGNRVPPTGDRCFVCGQDVDPGAESFHSVHGSPGVRMHLFQPGDRGHYNPDRPSPNLGDARRSALGPTTSRVAGAVSRASDNIWSQ
jgi:hypothetical protein